MRRDSDRNFHYVFITSKKGYLFPSVFHEFYSKLVKEILIHVRTLSLPFTMNSILKLIKEATYTEVPSFTRKILIQACLYFDVLASKLTFITSKNDPFLAVSYLRPILQSVDSLKRHALREIKEIRIRRIVRTLSMRFNTFSRRNFVPKFIAKKDTFPSVL